MKMRGVVYLYVDGESHYIMAEKSLKKIFGAEAELKNVKKKPDLASNAVFFHNQDAKFFWDSYATEPAGIPFPRVERAVYFTSLTGSPQDLHNAQVSIRDAGFEPQVSEEVKDSKKQRDNRLKNNAILIKPKGVDISLAVRMLEDAYYGNYQSCLLFTSDIDYLPVIEAVRRLGKMVTVVGFKIAIAKDSPFLYVAERFIDFSSHMRTTYAI